MVTPMLQCPRNHAFAYLKYVTIATYDRRPRQL